MPAQRPNILFITSDQQRGDALGVAGQSWLQTPTLDALARDGYYLTRCYSETPVCVAARTTWMTGQHPWAHGVFGNSRNAMNPENTLPGVLTRHGYRTHGAGKFHFTPDQRALNGFESTVICEEGRMPEGDDYHHWLQTTPWAGLERAHGVGNNDIFAAPSPVPESHYVSTWTANEAISFLNQHQATEPERPFYLHCSFTKPHSAYDPPRPYDQLYSPDEVPEPWRNGKDMTESPPQLRRANFQYTWHSLGSEQIALARAFYYGNITHLDHCIGRLLGVLDGLGLREQTVIVFNSDHGDLMGDHNLFFKSNFYEESTHVPLIVWAPESVRRELDLGPSRQIDSLTSQEQLMPFMLSAAGAEIPADVGTAPPLADVIAGRHPGEPVHGVFGNQENRQLALIEERYKYIWWANGRFEQLFDRQSDPTELTNLAGDPAYDDELGRMRADLVEIVRSHGGHAALHGDDLRGSDYEEATTRFGRPNPQPWGRRPY